jgi:hypothetical protein
MKPYGLKVIEHPDVADIHIMGSKSRTGKLGEHAYCDRPAAKARVRRYWKRIARRANKAACYEDNEP